jgi:SsrA-binding protein
MKIITVNKKAFHNYEILETIEAGLSLMGSEVKSIREGKVSLKDAYVGIRGGEAFLLNSHISPYAHASINNHEPERERKLLLHRGEIMKLHRKVKERGLSIIALKLYFNKKGVVKLEIGLAKGKRLWEKKQKIKDRDIKREADRELKYYKTKS